MIHTMYYSASMNPIANQAVGSFVCREVGIHVDKYCTMGVFENGDLIAGVIYHNYHPESGVIELSSASISKRWLTKHVIKSMFWMPFEKLGCQMVVLRVSEKNHQMISIARKFGFDEFLIPRLRGRNEAEYVFTFTDDQWVSSRYYGVPFPYEGVK